MIIFAIVAMFISFLLAIALVVFIWNRLITIVNKLQEIIDGLKEDVRSLEQGNNELEEAYQQEILDRDDKILMLEANLSLTTKERDEALANLKLVLEN